MSTIRFTAEVLPDGTIQPPEGIHLPPGKTEVIVNTGEPITRTSSLRNFAGVLHSGNPRSADNDSIDADMNKSNDESKPGSN